MSDFYALRLSGSGGQGLILAGIILAEAAGLYDGHHVTQSQSYGPEARGGNSMAEVLISDETIDYPRAIKLDFLVSLTQESAMVNAPALVKDGIFMVDPDLVSQAPLPNAILIPCTRIAFKVAKTQIAANMVALGAISALCPWVTPAALRKAIKKRLPAKIIEINQKAFNAGIREAKKFI